MIYAFLAVGSFWFWTLLVGLAIMEIVIVDREKAGVASGILIGSVILLAAITDFNPFAYVVEHPAKIATWAVLYFVLGIVYGWIKWKFYLLAAHDCYREFRSDFLHTRKIAPDAPASDIPAQTRRELHRVAVAGNYKPIALRNKARIVLWMTYWPFSAIWTLFNDPVRRMYQWVYGRLLTSYQAMADRQFRAYSDDFVEPIEPVGAAEQQ